MSRKIWDIGDRVCWPDTTKAAGPDNDRYLTVIDRQMIRYRSGRLYVRYKYAEILDRLAEDMRQNIADAYDNVLVVCGPERTGKSTLAYWSMKKFYPDLNLESAYAYTFETIVKGLAKKDPEPVYWLDEATTVAGNRDWMREDNKSFINLLEMMGSRRLTMYMCIPQIKRLDVYVRDFRVRYVLQTAPEAYWSKGGKQQRGCFELLLPQDDEEHPYRSVGFGEFPPMPEADKKVYEALKLRNQDDKLEEIVDRIEERKGKGKYRRDKDAIYRLLWHMYDTQGMDYKTISEISGIPYTTVKNAIWTIRQKEDP